MCKAEWHHLRSLHQLKKPLQPPDLHLKKHQQLPRATLPRISSNASDCNSRSCKNSVLPSFTLSTRCEDCFALFFQSPFFSIFKVLSFTSSLFVCALYFASFSFSLSLFNFLRLNQKDLEKVVACGDSKPHAYTSLEEPQGNKNCLIGYVHAKTLGSSPPSRFYKKLIYYLCISL